MESFGRDLFDASVSDAREVILLLSTPRSGSTFLSEQFRVHGGFVTHEYFNSKYGIPALAERWGCLDSAGRLDARRYIQELRRYRTGADGRLGINLHGSHVPIYALFARHLTDLPVRAIRLNRGDTISQAISLSIAKQSGRWSSNHAGRSDAIYNFEHITKMVEELARQNARMDAFEAAFNLHPTRLEYDEVVAAPHATVAAVLDVEAKPQQTSDRLEKQRGRRNAEWRERYIADSLKVADNGVSSPIQRIGARAVAQFGKKVKRLRKR
ncbi:hypothetical protein GCM10010915_09610 [Microbacterium faecale]|uniref:Sulphotransferase Stf0 domain-containing protein n=1 Tax=Microbacterium faecale TaxID=1804630 RepID=A0A917DEZ2_9MICO|nr:hypothetical protein GCM10010915_09610 [Microbacterium faecale]